MNSLVEGPGGTPDLTAWQHQINPPTLPGWSPPLPSSKSSSKNQTSLSALTPPHVPFVPCVSQGPSVVMMQPMQAGQGGKNAPCTLTLTNYLPIPLSLGGDLSNTHTPIWLQNQEKCQNRQEETATGELQLKGYSPPHSDHKKHQPQI